MEKNLQNYYKNVILYNLLSKLHFKNIFEITKITKMCLNIGFKNANIDKKNLINLILLVKLILNQKPVITRSRKTDLFLKIKKNSIVGCKVTLRKIKIFNLIEKLLLFILPNEKTIVLSSTNINVLNFQIKNVLNFFELKTEFVRFKKIPPIDISIHTNSKDNDELFVLLNEFLLLTK